MSETPLGKLLRLTADQAPGKLQQMVEAEHSQRKAHGRRLAMHPDFAQAEDVQTAIDALSRDLVRYGLPENAARTYSQQLVAKARREVSAKMTKPAKAAGGKLPAWTLALICCASFLIRQSVPWISVPGSWMTRK